MKRSITKILLPALMAAFIVTAGPAAAEKVWNPPPYYGPEKYAEIGGVRICYLEAGERNPETIVFIHGFSGNALDWSEQYDYFAARYHVLIYDEPGHGKSERRPGLSYSNELNGKTVIGLLDRAGVPKANLVGNSLGGQVAAWVAIHYPDRVGKLILVDAAGAHDFTLGVVITPLFNPLTLKLVGFTRGSAIPPDSPQNKARGDFRASLQGSDEEWPYLKTLSKAFREALRPVKHDLAKIQAPTLIIWGDDDPILNKRDVKIFDSLIPDSTPCFIHQGNHSPQITQPAEFNRVLDKFLSGGDMEGCYGANR
jgi:pimeloyl-ACP methyl ester carboxylesterase